MSVPDPLGRDRLAAGAAIYKPPVYGQKPKRKPFYRHSAFIGLVVIVALVAGILLRLRSGASDTPQAATTRVITLFLKGDYTGMRRALCREDRDQVGTNDLETAGRNAGPLLTNLDRPVISTVTDVTLTGDFAGVRAKQVAGTITAKIGAGTTFKVVTIQQSGGWRVCLTPGGYSLSAVNLDVPIGGQPQTIS